MNRSTHDGRRQRHRPLLYICSQKGYNAQRDRDAYPMLNLKANSICLRYDTQLPADCLTTVWYAPVFYMSTFHLTDRTVLVLLHGYLNGRVTPEHRVSSIGGNPQQNRGP